MWQAMTLRRMQLFHRRPTPVFAYLQCSTEGCSTVTNDAFRPITASYFLLS